MTHQNAFPALEKSTFFVKGNAILFYFILSSYSERYQKERNVKYVWSAQLWEKVPSLRHRAAIRPASVTFTESKSRTRFLLHFKCQC